MSEPDLIPLLEASIQLAQLRKENRQLRQELRERDLERRASQSTNTLLKLQAD
jgi:hypothetical protein